MKKPQKTIRSNLQRNLWADCHYGGFYKLMAVGLALCLSLFISSPSFAAFDLNFLPDTNQTDNQGDDNGFVGGEWLSSCGITGYEDSKCVWNKAFLTDKDGKEKKFDIANQQPYRMETVYVNEGGANDGLWYHILLGNVDDEWKQDTYVKMSGQQSYMTGGQLENKSCDNCPLDGTFSESGGLVGAFQSGGDQIASMMDAKAMDGCALYAGNACDPLAIYNSNNDGTANGITDHRNGGDWTGNGTGNPTRVIMRQVDGGTESYQEFLKPAVDKKPLIYQEFNDVAQGVSGVFQADMRALDYNTLNTALTIGGTALNPNTAANGAGKGYSTNATYTYSAANEFVLQVNFTDGGLGADFDASGTSPISGDPLAKQNVTAGMYTYTAGAGWTTTGNSYYSQFYNRTITDSEDKTWDSSDWGPVKVFQEGTYTYNDGDFDQTALDWWNFMDPNQNVCNGSPFCPVP